MWELLHHKPDLQMSYKLAEEMRMRIPVVFATDKNYLFYTCIAITSLAKYADLDTEYDIYILMDEDSSEHALLEKIAQRYASINIHIIKVCKNLFQDVIINNKHITKATFYRLALCSLIDIDKCIYLDSDVIATDDLQELFSTNMDGYYVAGCRDTWIDMISEKEREVRRKKTGQIPSLDEYINAGVMVLNLRKIKEDGLDHIFMEQLNKDYLFEDQDIINISCYGKIKHLPARWNIFTVFLRDLDELKMKGISGQVIEAFKSRKGILHYATPPIRPWEHSFCYANREWWDIASEWKDEEAYMKIKAKIQEKEEQYHWTYYMEKCKEYRKIAIFGFTHYGKMFCDWLVNNGFQDKLVFCDNAPEKKNLSYKGIQVISLADIEKKDILFVNCSQRRNAEVTEMLLEAGIKKEDIIVYIHEKWEYYYNLDERYYLEELRDIFYRERGADVRGFEENLYEMQRILLRNPEYQDWHGRYNMNIWILKGKEVC